MNEQKQVAMKQHTAEQGMVLLVEGIRGQDRSHSLRSGTLVVAQVTWLDLALVCWLRSVL